MQAPSLSLAKNKENCFSTPFLVVNHSKDLKW